MHQIAETSEFDAFFICGCRYFSVCLYRTKTNDMETFDVLQGIETLEDLRTFLKKPPYRVEILSTSDYLVSVVLTYPKRIKVAQIDDLPLYMESVNELLFDTIGVFMSLEGIDTFEQIKEHAVGCLKFETFIHTVDCDFVSETVTVKENIFDLYADGQLSGLSLREFKQ